MENLHPLVIGIRSEENYTKLVKMIHGIGRIPLGINEAVDYGKTLNLNRVPSTFHSMSQQYKTERDQNVIQLLDLLPRITIPKGALIFHSNKFTSDGLNEFCQELERRQGFYPIRNQCETCQIKGVVPGVVPYERAGDTPRISELVMNPNDRDSTAYSCKCEYRGQHRMYGNFNFTGNYRIAVHTPMRGTHAYIVTEDIIIIDATYSSIELGYSIKNYSDIGDTRVLKQYCIDHKLDGITLFDQADKQRNVSTSYDDLKKGAENSCYIYEENSPITGLREIFHLCPEIILFHNNNDSEWATFPQTNVNNIGTRKLKIMGMVDLVDNQGQPLSRDKVSNMFDILFSNYLRYIPMYNAQQLASGTGKQIEDIEIVYSDTNIYKMIIHKNGSDENQNILFELITLTWTNMDYLEYSIKGNVPLADDLPLKFFNVDEHAELITDLPKLNKPEDWIRLYSNINIDFDLTSRLNRNPLYSSETIFDRILRARNISSFKKYILYMIFCLKIIPAIKDAINFDIIDVLEGIITDDRINTAFTFVLNSIKADTLQYFIIRNTFIFKVFEVPFNVVDQSFYNLIEPSSLSNELNIIPKFMYTKDKTTFINIDTLKVLTTNFLQPHIQQYIHKFSELFKTLYLRVITSILNQHFKNEVITNESFSHILDLFNQRYTPDKGQEFLNRIYNSYGISDIELFYKSIGHMMIDLINFFWNVFTDYIITNRGVTINGKNTKEYMDNLFIDFQRDLYFASSFYYEVQTADVAMSYSPLYYYSPIKNVMYVYLENETVDIEELWNYYYKNKDSDILDLIYSLEKS